MTKPPCWHCWALPVEPKSSYSLPQLGALNFVLHDALGSGVTRSLCLDAHGKCLGSAILSLDIDMTVDE